MSKLNALVSRATITSLCKHRSDALWNYQQALDHLGIAKEQHTEAAPRGSGISLPSRMGELRVREQKDRDDLMEDVRKSIDQDMWRVLLKLTPIWSLMDKKEREVFEHDITTNPPPVTPENVASTLVRLQRDSETIFKRGIINAFQELSRNYKSNDGFKLGERIVLEYAIEWCPHMHYFQGCYRAEEKLKDVDRIMHVLDGREVPGYQEGLCAEFRRLVKEYRTTQEHTLVTEYWKLKMFKKGTIHLHPLRPDLLDKANRLIAEHYGKVIGDKSAAAKGPNGYKRPRHAPDMGDFPTPVPVVQRVLEFAGIKPGMEVLEPSAGVGNLACEAVALGAIVDVVEIQGQHIRELKSLGIFRSVTKGDFLDHPVPTVYDAVVGNPPFSRKADILHLIHAWKSVKPGGTLVFVMSRSSIQGTHKLNDELRELVSQNTSIVEDLPDGSFKELNTNVRTSLVKLVKGERDDL